MKDKRIRGIKRLLLFLLAAFLLTGCSDNSFGSAREAPAYSQIDQETAREIATGEITMEIPENMKTIYLAGGCFWGMQKFFDQFDGVIQTEVGYANGPDEAPSYHDVCSSSGHAETVRVDYDPEVISLTDLLNYYFMVIRWRTFSLQRSIIRSIWTRIPAATVISRAITLIFSKTARKKPKRSCGRGSATWPLRSRRMPPRNMPSPANMTTSSKRASTSILSAANRSSRLWTSIIPGVAGRRSPGRSRKMLSLRPWTLHMVWSGRKCAAAARILIWVMCSTTVQRNPAGCVIASIPRHFGSFLMMSWKSRGTVSS